MGTIVSNDKPVAVDPNCGVCSQRLTVEEVTDLLNGKAVAVEVNGEYTLFIGCDLFFSWKELDNLADGCAKKWHEEHDQVAADVPSDEDVKSTIIVLNDAVVNEIVSRWEGMMGPGPYKEAILALIRSQDNSVVIMEERLHGPTVGER